MRRKLTQFPDIIDYQKFFGGEMKKEFNLATDSWIKLAGRPPFKNWLYSAYFWLFFRPVVLWRMKRSGKS